MTDQVQFKVDSKAAQADLLALSRALDTSTAAAVKMDKAFSTMANATSANLTRAAKAMEKYAAAANLVSKINIGSMQAAQLRELGNAIDSLAKARQISFDKISALRGLGAALKQIRMPERLGAVLPFLNELGRIRAPTMTTIKNIEGLFIVLNNFKDLSTPQAGGLASLFRTINTLHSPNKATIDNLERLFVVLSTAKEIPGATRIVTQLDMIAAAATRASRALAGVQRVNGLPTLAGAGGGGGGRYGEVGAAAAASSAGGNNLNKTLEESEKRSTRARASFSLLANSLGGLSGRMRLSYQAGTLLNAAFGAITIGRFLKSIYEANIQFLKLQKAVLFATDSFDGAEEATDRFVAISQKLGLSIKDNIETYGRFVIAATASNLPLKQTNDIYESIGTAMTVVGASATQQQLAFYGLTEMMQKGVVYSKEFNRQIGAQLPGNAILGARALSVLEHRTVSVTEFFERMHKGTLISAQFVPVWAAMVKKMYGDLLPLAQLRPDVAVTRLGNAFRSFAREVATGGMMTAIGSSINSITSQFVDKEGKLTEHAREMAQTFGSVLANAIRIVGEAFKWLTGHLDQVIFGIQVMAAFSFAHKITEWGTAAFGAAKGFEKLAASISASNAASTSLFSKLGKINLFQRGSTAAATVGAAKATTVAYQGEQLGLFPPIGKQESLHFGPPLTEPARSGLAAGMSDAEKMEMMAATSVGQGIQGLNTVPAATGLARLVPVLGAITGVASGAALAMVAVGIALGGLLLFGAAMSGVNAGKTAKGHDLTYGDISASALKDIKNQVLGTIKEITGGLGNLAVRFLNFLGVTGNGGEVFAKVIATLEALFGGLYMEIAEPARLVIAIFKTIFDVLKDGAIMVTRALSGDFKGAGAAYDLLKNDMKIDWKEFAKGFAKDLQGASISAHYNTIMNGASTIADTRNTRDTNDAATKRAMEAALRQDSASRVIENAAQIFSGAVNRDIAEKIDPDVLIARMKAVAAGNVGYGLSSTQIQAAGPYAAAGAKADVLKTVSDAAALFKVDPALLYNLGLSESHYDAKQYNWAGNGTSARGPFQLTTGALNQVHKDYPDIDVSAQAVLHLASAAKIAAAYLGIESAEFKKYAKRDLQPQEALLPYKLGAYGAAQLANAIIQNPRELAKDLFPAAAAAAGNKSLFYAKDPITKKYTAPRTVTELYASYIKQATPNTFGAADTSASEAAGGPPDMQLPSGETMAQAHATDTMSDKTFKVFQELIAKGSPAAAAAAQMDEQMLAISQAMDKIQQDALAHPFSKTFLADQQILQGATHAIEELKKRREEALDPIAHANRLQEDANKLTRLQIAGLGDEAEYQKKINDLVEQGDIRDAIDLKQNHEKFLALQAETRALETILGLQKELLGLDTKRLELTSANPYQNNLNQLLGSQAQPGETSVAQVLDRLNKTPGGQKQLAADQTYAQAKTQFDTAAAQKGISDQLGAMASEYGLNETDKQRLEDYRTFLQQLTGMNTQNLADLEKAAGETGKAFASQAADLKQQLENPPGFQKWVDGLEPFAKRMEDIKANFMSSLSDDITNALSGDNVDWSALAKDINKQMIHAQVDEMLKGTLGALGLTGPLKPEDKLAAASESLDTVAKEGLGTASVNLTSAADALKEAAGALGGAATGTQSVANSVNQAVAGASTAGAQTTQALTQALSAGASGVTGGEGSVTPGIETITVPSGGAGGWPGGGDTSALMQQIQATAAGNLGTTGDLSGLTTTLPTLNFDTAATGAAASGAAGASGMAGMGAMMGGPAAIPMMAMSAISNAVSNIFPGKAPDGNQYKPNYGRAAAGMFGMVGNLLGSLLFPMQEETKPTYHMPNGIIGAMSTNTVSATQVAAQPNILGSILSAAVGLAGSMASGQVGKAGGGLFNSDGFFSHLFNGGGGLGTTSNSILNMFGGGLHYGSGIGELADVPPYAEGTPNTSGMLAMIHPDEAIIPLTRGRSVPVDMRGNNGGDTHLHSTVNISTPDVGGFRKSRGAIARDQNRILKRNAVRNQPSYH